MADPEKQAPQTQSRLGIVAARLLYGKVLWVGTFLAGASGVEAGGGVGLAVALIVVAVVVIAAAVIQRRQPGLAVVYDPRKIRPAQREFVARASARLKLKQTPVLIRADRGMAAYASSGRTPVVVVNADFADRLEEAELHAVIAHELGEHALRSRHIRQAAWIFGGALAATAFLIWSTSGHVPAVGLVLAAVLLPPAILREIEYAADRRALRAGADPEALVRSFDRAYAFAKRTSATSHEPGIPIGLPPFLALHPRLAARKRRVRRAARRLSRS